MRNTAFTGYRLLLIFLFSLLAVSVIAQPTVTSFSPLSGSVNTTVVITGSNFSSIATNNIVYFGAARATVSSATSTTLVVAVPYGATHKPITVTVNSLTASSRLPFVVTFGGGGAINAAYFGDYTMVEAEQNVNSDDIVSCDLDGDGKPDVAIADKSTSSVFLYRNIGTGENISFSPKLELASSGVGFRMCSGDINGDGKQDIITANGTEVSVFLNFSSSGLLSFAAPVGFTVTGPVMDVEVGDFNNDGKPDIITSSSTLEGYVSVLRNTSTGGTLSFASKQDFQMIGPIASLAIQDVDGDGKVDVAGACFGANAIRILKNESTGGNISFAATPFTFTTGALAMDVAFADLNRDGKPDMVVGNSLGGRVSVFRNTSTGPGSFTYMYEQTLNAGEGADAITLADFNGDGRVDIGVANALYSIVLFQNISPGINISFDLPAKIETSISNSITAADFNGDGRVDIVHTAGANRAIAWKNKAAHPQPLSFTPTSGGRGTIVTIQGANFTGVSDVKFGGVPATSFTVQNSTRITAVVGDGATGEISITGPGGVSKIQGFTYLLAPEITAFTPTVAGTGASVIISGTHLDKATAVTFGGVSANFFSVINENEIYAVVGAGGTGAVTVIGPNGIGSLPGFTFVPLPVITNFSPASGYYGDTMKIVGSNFQNLSAVKIGGIPVKSMRLIDNNTIEAVIGGGATGRVQVTAVGGTGQSTDDFTFISLPGPLITNISPLIGYVESVVTITGQNFSPIPENNTVYFGPAKAVVNSASSTELRVIVPPGAGSGNISVTTNLLTATSPQVFQIKFDGGGDISPGSFGPPERLTADGFIPRKVNIADIDLDGKNDLVVAFVSSVPIILRNNSTGMISFEPPVYATGTFSTSRLLTVDMDGDGKKDIVTLQFDSNPRFAIARNVSVPGTISFAPKWEAPSMPYLLSDIQSGDLNGDGKPDIVITTIGYVFVFLNTGTLNYFQFSAPITMSSPGINGDINIVDLDGDGRLDIFHSKRDNDQHRLAVWINQTSGNDFEMAPRIEYVLTDNAPYNIVSNTLAADFDRDGRIDIATSFTGVPSPAVLFMRNESSPGAFQIGSIQTVPSSQLSPEELWAEDMDGDGLLDIALTHASAPFRVGAMKNVSVPGSILFEAPVPFTEGTNGTVDGIAVGDLDGDMKPEIVTTGAGSGNFLLIYKNKTDGPHIDSFTPANAVQGMLVTLQGRHFTGASEVRFGNIAATSFNVVSSTTIEAVVGNGAEGQISVTTPIATTYIDGFKYNLLPEITSFIPVSGAPGTEITITGINLERITSVQFGGSSTSQVTIVSPTTIKVKVPSTANSGAITVINSAGAGSLDGFTFIHATPIISSFSPTSTTKGSSVIIYGSYFRDILEVKFGGVPAASFVVVSQQQIKAIVGEGASGAVTVTNAGGTGSRDGFIFLQPVITSFTPVQAPRGVTITINGANFEYANQISFGGVAATIFTVISSSKITAIVPPGAASGSIKVTSPLGSGELAGFIYIPDPTITSFSPQTASPRSIVTIRGTGLLTTSQVMFGGVPANSFTVTSDTEIKAEVGMGASGAIVVTTQGGEASKDGFELGTYTPVIDVDNEVFTSIQLAPNPAYKGYTIARHPSVSRKAVIQIYSMEGRKQIQVDIPILTKKTEIALTGIPAGHYLIIWYDGKDRLSQNLIIP